MRKIFFSIFLVLFLNSNVNAEWTKVSMGKSGATLYMDRQTLKIGKNSRFILIMFNYSEPSSYGDRSSRSYREINCDNMMYRDLVKDYFVLPSANGKPTEGSGTLKDPKWKYANPKSIAGSLHRKVCKM